MSAKTKKLKGTTIEIRKDSIKFIPEDKTYPWWREQLNRKTEAILCPQIMQYIFKITSNLTQENDKGQRIGKYDFFITNLPPTPTSSQGKKKARYKKHLINYLKKKVMI